MAKQKTIDARPQPQVQKFNIHTIVRMRDTLNLLIEGQRKVWLNPETEQETLIKIPFVFPSWEFRIRLATNYDKVQTAIKAFEDARKALSYKHTGSEESPDEKHPKYQLWLFDVNTAANEMVPIELATLNLSDFNGDENRTLPAEVLVKLQPIIDMTK